MENGKILGGVTDYDDLDGRFLVFGFGWEMRECGDDWFGACFGKTYFSNGRQLASEYAAWQPYFHDLLGYYDVYAFIPRDFADSTLAYYQIHHTGQTLSAGIDQSRFNRTTWSNPWAYLGRYNFSETVTPRQAVRVYHVPSATDPRESVGADAVVFVRADGPPNLVLNIAQNSDDAGRNPDTNCSFGTENREIYLGRCDDGTLIVSGFRYSNVNLPAGATILRAHLEFTADGPYEAALSLRFYGENNPASPTFSDSNRPEARTRTLIPDVWVRWDIPAADRWQHQGLLYPRRHSPDLGPIVQALVNHPEWVQGQSHLTFIVKPAPNFDSNVHRRVMAYERNQPPPGTHSARLLVWYTTGNP
jgi:hypothetical protein